MSKTKDQSGAKNVKHVPALVKKMAGHAGKVTSKGSASVVATKSKPSAVKSLPSKGANKPVVKSPIVLVKAPLNKAGLAKKAAAKNSTKALIKKPIVVQVIAKVKASPVKALPAKAAPAKAAPAAKSAPVMKAAPAAKSAPVMKAAPVIKAGPAAKVAPTAKAIPAAKAAPAAKSMPVAKVLSQAGEKPLAEKSAVPVKAAVPKGLVAGAAPKLAPVSVKAVPVVEKLDKSDRLTAVSVNAPKVVKMSKQTAELNGKAQAAANALLKSPFSTEEIAQWRKILVERRYEISSDIGALEKDAMEAEDGHTTPLHAAERGSDADLQDVSLGLAGEEKDLLWQVDRALRKIDVGSPLAFGLCEFNKEPIPKLRLQLIPWTPLSFEGAVHVEQNNLAIEDVLLDD